MALESRIGAHVPPLALLITRTSRVRSPRYKEKPRSGGVFSWARAAQRNKTGTNWVERLARDLSDRPPATQPKPPKPGSVPKLPQTIFNLEKRGGSGNRSGNGGFGRGDGAPASGRS